MIIQKVHISDITSGDTIIRDGKPTTVGQENIKYNKFMGLSLFGDTYRLGTQPVLRIQYPKVSHLKTSDHE